MYNVWRIWKIKIRLTWGSNWYANQMLTRLTGQNIHKKANYRAHTTGVDVEEREKNNHVEEERKRQSCNWSAAQILPWTQVKPGHESVVKWCHEAHMKVWQKDRKAKQKIERWSWREEKERTLKRSSSWEETQVFLSKNTEGWWGRVRQLCR